MGSTLSTLRDLLINQLDYETSEIDANSDPSSTLLDNYINKAIRRIVRRDRPRELENSAAISIDSIANQNTVTIPATIFVTDNLYYNASQSAFRRLKQESLFRMIEIETAQRFFDTSNTGDPTMFSVRGTSYVFNRSFTANVVGALKAYGLAPPTALSGDSDTTELPIDYDLLIVYEAAYLFYQKDDDTENQQKFQILAKQERDEIRNTLSPNNEDRISLDNDVFVSQGTTTISNPSVFFGA